MTDDYDLATEVAKRKRLERENEALRARLQRASRTPCNRCKGSGRQPGLYDLNEICGRCGGNGLE